MPRYTSSQTFTEGNTQIVALPDPEESKAKVAKHPEEEDLEVKLRRITDEVPTRVQNTSGSSAGSGSGDFHQYRQMRRHEQDRLMRMEVDYQRRKEAADFEARREEMLRATEERTAKRRAKRLKKKAKKKAKVGDATASGAAGGDGLATNGGGEEDGEDESDGGVQADLD
eukprot:SM000129S26164  [mRNA]  locus=s129:317771:318783:- [translate_table: standard]